MVIMQNKTGQLANRLFSFSHFIGNAIEHDYTLVNTAFGEYCKYFQTTRNNDFGEHSIYVKFEKKIPYSILQRLKPSIEKYFPESRWHEFVTGSDTQEWDLNSADFVEKAKRKVVFIKSGWLFRDNRNFVKHGATIKSFFSPVAEAQENINRLIADCRSECDVLIGVHIRRGDYKEWQGGKYYFTDKVNSNLMAQLSSQFKARGKKAAFLICSNEVIDEKFFRNHNVILGTGEIIEDLYSLSECDYIFGPPSTFSMWASFYGKTPLLHIEDPDKKIATEDFHIV